jgi:hypothetical protein
MAKGIVSKIKTGGSNMKDTPYLHKGPTVTGYADNEFLFNPETNKSTGEVGPRYLKKDPLSWEDLESDPVEKKPIVGPAAPIPTIVHGPDTEHSPCCDPPKDQTGHDAFGIRLCSVCGKMSDKAHRSECTSTEYNDDPERWPQDIELHVRKISNGYVVSVDHGEQTFYAHDTVIVVLFRDLLKKLL